MHREWPSLSTDQIATFVELARCGSLRAAAKTLHITEQGARNRLLALEVRLKVELYRKVRGPRRATPLTPSGRDFLPHAQAFLERACELSELFHVSHRSQEIHVAASQYLLTYVLIDAVRKYQAQEPNIHIRLSTHNEREIEQVLLNDPNVAVGVAAPYEPVVELQYQHVFSMNWSFIAPLRHPLAKIKSPAVRLKEIVDERLILFERGSTGRQHILDAFGERGLTPRIHTETTTTEIIVRMVEAGLGVAIVPLLSSGVVTKGRKVAIRKLADPIRPINSGILTRRGEQLPPSVQKFIDFIRGK